MKILVVDKNPDMYNRIARMVRKQIRGAELILVTNQMEFEKAIIHNKFDAVIAEYHLKWADGLHVVKTIKDRVPSVQVIMITGAFDGELAAKCMKAGLGNYITRKQLHRLPFLLKEGIKRSGVPEEKYEKSMRADGDVQKTEIQYGPLFEKNPHPMWIVDSETRAFLAVNDAAVSHYGYSREEFFRMTISDICPSCNMPGSHSNTNTSSGYGTTTETKHLKKDGSLIDVEIVKNPFLFKGKKAEFFLVFDITKRKQVEDALRRRMEFEKTIARISTRFVALSDFNNAISESLADVGRLSNASRVYLFQFRDRSTIIDNTHEWCNEGVTPEIQNLQNLPSENFPWWMKSLGAGKMIQITDVSRMPPEAEVEKVILKKQGIKSLLSFPVYAEKELVGFIGFDNVVSTGQRHEENLTLLKITSEIIGNAIVRRRVEEALKRRIDFERTVADISTRFVVLSDFDNAITASLADAGRLSGASRTYLLQFRNNGDMANVTHEWCQNGVTSEIQNSQNLPFYRFQWGMKNLQSRKVIHIEDVFMMPPEASAEKEFLQKRNVRSMLALPMYIESTMVGVIGFEHLEVPGRWQEEDIALLHIIAEIIKNAIAHKQSEALINHMAFHDHLTNLPNRALFQEHLRKAIAQANRSERIIAVMLLDLDCFKTINDSWGHHTGDMLLKSFAERLKERMREGDIIARMGGDEFFIVLSDLSRIQDAAVVAKKIIDALHLPFHINDHNINITVSIGISFYPFDANDVEDLIKKADSAMYSSKKRGGNTYCFYNAMETQYI